MKRIGALLLIFGCLLSVGCAAKKGKTPQESVSSSATTTSTSTSTSTSAEGTTALTTTSPVGTTSDGIDVTVVVPSTTEELPSEEYPYEYSIDISPYLSYLCPEDPTEYLVLANRYHALGSDYVPNDLVPISSGSNWYLREAAKVALDAMILEMKARGVYDSFAQSTYRSYNLQDKLYKKYLSEEAVLHPELSHEELMSIVDTYSARPGTSDHQTGLAVDFYPITARFENYRMFKYLVNNAHKFGFILRFPEGKTYLTGFMYESWHWRFVGREAATYIYENDLTLEEYVAQVNGAPLTTFPETTKTPAVTRPSTTEKVTTPPATTEPMQTTPVTTEKGTTPPVTTTEPTATTPNESTAPPTTSPSETVPPTTSPVTTELSPTETTVPADTTVPPVTEPPSTTEPLPPVTEPVTTEPPVSEPSTTEPQTTEPTTSEPENTAPSTTETVTDAPSETSASS